MPPPVQGPFNPPAVINPPPIPPLAPVGPWGRNPDEDFHGQVRAAEKNMRMLGGDSPRWWPVSRPGHESDSHRQLMRDQAFGIQDPFYPWDENWSPRVNEWGLPEGPPPSRESHKELMRERYWPLGREPNFPEHVPFNERLQPGPKINLRPWEEPEENYYTAPPQPPLDYPQNILDREYAEVVGDLPDFKELRRGADEAAKLARIQQELAQAQAIERDRGDDILRTQGWDAYEAYRGYPPGYFDRNTPIAPENIWDREQKWGPIDPLQGHLPVPGAPGQPPVLFPKPIGYGTGPQPPG